MTSWCSCCCVHRAVSAPGKGQFSLSKVTLQIPRSDTAGPSFLGLLQGFFLNILMSSEQSPSPAHPALSCPAFQAMGLLGGNRRFWSHIPVLLNASALVKKVLNWFVCFAFLLFYLLFFLLFFLFPISAASFICLKQEAQLQTPSKFKTYFEMRFGSTLLSLFFPSSPCRKLLLHEHKHLHHTSCSPMEPPSPSCGHCAPSTPKALSEPGCTAGCARPTLPRKHSRLLRCFLEN